MQRAATSSARWAPGPAEQTDALPDLFQRVPSPMPEDDPDALRNAADVGLLGWSLGQAPDTTIRNRGGGLHILVGANLGWPPGMQAVSTGTLASR
jgi:hypothetical protein